MNERRTSLEIIAPIVDEAVEKGLAELGLPIEAVEVEVLDEGSRGIFGIGGRQARVRLTILDLQKEKEPTAEHVILTGNFDESKEQDEEGEETTEQEAPEVTQIINLTQSTLDNLLEKMGISAEVIVTQDDTPDKRGRIPIKVDILGKDLSILIGKNAETLYALQYITTLIVNKQAGVSIPIHLDVEGYRRRREQQLRQMAHRVAEQVIKTGRRQILEPMSASERRVIHIELKENLEVTTESIGEEPYRKVTINPK